MMNKRLQAIKYVLADLLAAAIAWAGLYGYRKIYIEPNKYGYSTPFEIDKQFYLGITIIPILWVTVYALLGNYRQVYRKSRLKELGETLYVSLIGVLVIFFLFLLDDEILTYKTYYQTLFILFSLHFMLTAGFRFILSTQTAILIQQRKIGFNTLIIGSNTNALNLYTEIENQPVRQGYRFVGFVHVANDNHLLDKHLPNKGHIQHLASIVKKEKIEEVLIAIESHEHGQIQDVINQLEDTRIIIKIIPDMYDILLGSVKMTAIYGALLIEITPFLMPEWQQSLKRAFDIVVSLLILTIFSPVYLLTALFVKLSSKGPILYMQERIGIHGIPFKIYKFRSMYVGAEKSTPQLASKNDNRITPFGKMMRKSRLDEIPQFYNVLIGDMSIVGPRPERQFFIDQILPKAPHYKHLQRVRPGITSWGQVKYGYAENVDQMVDRLKFDIMYIENMSLALDFKIMIYTVLTVIQGRGK